MGSAPSHPGRVAGRLGGRALILLVAGITILLTLGLLINDLVRVFYIFEGAYGIEARIVSYEGVPANLSGDSELTQSYYETVLLSSFQELQLPRTLQAIAVGATTLTFVSGAVAILLLCRRLWTGRTFATSAAVALLVVSGLTLFTAWLAPWLRHRADAIAFETMGYGTSGGSHWVERPHYVAGSVDDTVLLLGVVLALAGLVYLGARRLQHDAEGLV